MRATDSSLWVGKKFAVVPADKATCGHAGMPASTTRPNPASGFCLSAICCWAARDFIMFSKTRQEWPWLAKPARARRQPSAGRERPDIILIDLDLRADAFQCMEKIVAAAPDSRVIALSIGHMRPITMC